MALLWYDGFEHYADDQDHFDRRYAAVTANYSSKSGRLFGNAAQLSSGAFETPSLGLSDTMVIGMAIKVPSNPGSGTGRTPVAFLRGGTEQIRLEFVGSAGHFNFAVKRGATTLATTVGDYSYGIWHYFEFKVNFHTSTGSYELRHNEVTQVSGSGVNTAESGSNQADQWRYNFTTTGPDYDDLYLLDTTGSTNNDFLGDTQIEAITVSADGAQNDWTAQEAGTNAQMVDDPGAPDDGTNVILSNTATDIDVFNMTNLVNTLGTVHAVGVQIQARVDASGSRTLRSKFHDGTSTFGNGAQFTVSSTSFAEFVTIMETNPVTASAWAVSEIDAGQYGVEVVT